MYRSVALAALRARRRPRRRRAVGRAGARRSRSSSTDGAVRLDGEDVSDAIREPEVTDRGLAGLGAPAVREAMVARQRELIERGGYVAEGRDIGTVVSPDAPLKVFLTASDEERARRRAAETGEDAATVLDAQAARDARDSEREHGALRAGRGRGRARHDRPLGRRGRGPRSSRWPASGGSREHDAGAAADRRRRLSQRRQVAPSSTGSPAAARRSSTREPGVTRDRKAVECEWNGVRFELVDTGGVDLAAEDSLSRAVQRQAREAIAEADAVAAGRRRPRRAGPRRRRARRDPARRRRPGARRRQQGRPARGRAADRRAPRARPRRAAPGLGDATASAPATCSTASPSSLGDVGAGRRSDEDAVRGRGHRPPQRRQVLAGQRASSAPSA